MTDEQRQARRHYLKGWRALNRERIKGYQEKRREHHRADMRRYAAANVDKIRNYQLVKRYGISLDDYDRMAAEQGRACKICHTKAEEARNARLYVDHCHTTKKVRGLLCSQCNRALGMFGDDAQRIARALRYLGGGE